MPKLAFFGKIEVPKPTDDVFGAHLRDQVAVKQTASLNLGRGLPTARQTLSLSDDTCVELQLSSGLRLWTRSDDLERDLGLRASRGPGGELELPRALAFGAQSRSDETDAVITGLKVFGVDIPGAIADFIASRVERGVNPGGMLCQCTPTSAAALSPATKLAGNGPTLVFLHGTASSTDGSFGGLWEAVGDNRLLRLVNPGAKINGLFEAYQNRVLALQHRSLTESPIQNAVALARQLAEVLPGGAELHLVSHSRGGLIGELMSRGSRTGAAPFDDVDLGVFGNRPDRQMLVDLGDVLQEQRFRVTRFVRVACPAGGTTLADGRLDRYFSVLVNIVRQIPALAANPLYEALTSVLAAVLKERTDPASLPGLEAMMPISPLVKMLNRRDVQEDTALHVLGGDLAMSGFWGTLKALATDFYYREDHDLVVNTRSMLRGAQRTRGVKYWIDTGGEVTHFNYFHRADTASRLCDALLGKNDEEFHALTVKPFDVGAGDYQKRAASQSLPILFVVPDFMGSHLSVSGRVWADAVEISKGRLKLLEANPATADGVVGTYAPLVQHLSATHEVVPFAYDWRRSCRESADTLAQAIAQRLPDAVKFGRPIRILAHGTGGLVVRAMIASKAPAWEQMRPLGGTRVVLLGMPARGSFAAAALLTGRDRLSQQIAMIDLTRGENDVLQMFSGFDGLLDWLPDDCFETAWWDTVERIDAQPGSPRPATVRPADDRLVAARNRRAELDAVALDPSQVVYVAGTAALTPIGIASSQTAAGPPGTLLGTLQGDGRVPWSDIPPELANATYYADAEHGALVTTAGLLPALAELVSTGATKRLAARPPGGRGAAAEPLALNLRSVEMIPDEAELVASALGLEIRPDRTPATPKVRLRVVHGNLARATSPVLVGHYQDDVFASAEEYLDRQLLGRLRELHRMDLYPRGIRTGVVVANEPGSKTGVHPGAVVVGLGVVGDLTPGALVATLEHGLALYGADRVGLERRRRQRKPDPAEPTAPPVDTVSAPITALLVGSGEGGVTLADSLQSLLRAVVRANQRLDLAAGEKGSAGSEDRLSAVIDRLDVFELYEDRAIAATHMVNRLVEAAEFKDAFIVEPRLVRSADGRQRASFEEQLSWWQRIRITEPEPDRNADSVAASGTLKFEALTERARIEAYVVPGQRELVDAFVDRAIATTSIDPALGRTLFQMIVPNRLKEQAPDRRPLVLLLDGNAAALPWELLQDGFDRGAPPLSVQAGMIRQLLVSQGRERVRGGHGKTALVIGNPQLTDRRFAPLPGASRETEAVKRRLDAAEYKVEALIDGAASPMAIFTALHDRAWRVLHVAAHGVYEFAPEEGAAKVSGIVLGDGMFLKACDIEQMWFVPELVFLNCCYLGRGTEERSPVDYPSLAANVAEQFIRMGTRVVVAAGWAVDDGAAELFAETFYEQMLLGTTFGDAVQVARTAVYGRFPNGNTWGAYQCYGDPAFSLRAGLPSLVSRQPVSERELIVQAASLAASARTGWAGRSTEAIKSLDALVAQASPDWLDDAVVCAALGTAYGELKAFPAAIDYYTRVWQAERAEAPVRALEQLANLEVRYAEHLWREGSADPMPHLSRAETRLKNLIALAPTAERLSMLGGLYKRKAMIVTTTVERGQALNDMASTYLQAYQHAVTTRQPDPWYPLVNRLAALVSASWQAAPDAALQQEIAKNLQDVQALAAALESSARSFWELSFLVDASLMAALVGDLLAASRPDLVSRYRGAERRGASAREMDSVVSHLRFLNMMAGGGQPAIAAELAALVQALQT